jgi:hypothetical protein
MLVIPPSVSFIRSSMAQYQNYSSLNISVHTQMHALCRPVHHPPASGSLQAGVCWRTACSDVHLVLNAAAAAAASNSNCQVSSCHSLLSSSTAVHKSVACAMISDVLCLSSSRSILMLVLTSRSASVSSLSSMCAELIAVTAARSLRRAKGRRPYYCSYSHCMIPACMMMHTLMRIMLSNTSCSRMHCLSSEQLRECMHFWVTDADRCQRTGSACEADKMLLSQRTCSTISPAALTTFRQCQD